MRGLLQTDKTRNYDTAEDDTQARKRKLWYVVGGVTHTLTDWRPGGTLHPTVVHGVL